MPGMIPHPLMPAFIGALLFDFSSFAVLFKCRLLGQPVLIQLCRTQYAYQFEIFCACFLVVLMTPVFNEYLGRRFSKPWLIFFKLLQIGICLPIACWRLMVTLALAIESMASPTDAVTFIVYAIFSWMTPYLLCHSVIGFRELLKKGVVSEPHRPTPFMKSSQGLKHGKTLNERATGDR